MVSSLDIAWAAGIFEGEGHCRTLFNGKRKNPGMTTRTVIVQKDPWLLHRLVEIFGFGKVHLVNKGSGNSCYAWDCYGSNSRGFLMTIYKFLSPRRQKQVRDCGFMRCQNG